MNFEITEFYDGKSLKLTGENALLSDDLSAGIISAAQVLIDDTIRLRAEEITLKNRTLDYAKNINRITSCEECENGFPLWHFTASSATNDLENQNIVYRNVTLSEWSSYWIYPTFDYQIQLLIEREAFLVSVSTITSNLGVGIKLPYFIPIGESRDFF